ncbi:MAG: hypothetical protein IPG96_08200 [Proteobacteria bacterium]|nr:hypothetical protein [Pseudomonadota bacterium]
MGLDELRRRWAAKARAWPLGWFARRAVVKGLTAQFGLDERPDLDADLPLLERLQGCQREIDGLAPQLSRLPGWSALNSDPALLNNVLDLAERLRSDA